MTDLDELAALRAKATPGPWIRPWGADYVHHMGGDDALRSQEDIDFAIAAANLDWPALASRLAALELVAEAARRDIAAVQAWHTDVNDEFRIAECEAAEDELRAVLDELDAAG